MTASPSPVSLQAPSQAARVDPAVLRPWVMARRGWSRRGVAFAAGSVSVLALAPFFIWPILFLTLPVLVWLLDASDQASAGRRTWLAAAGAGWWFGFGYFVFGLFWIGEAFLVEADKFAWALPFAVTLMPAGLSLFYAAATAAASRLWLAGAPRLIVLAIALAAAEWLRGHVLTGFPWNVLGYALTYPEPMMQSAGLVGIYGLTLWAVVIFTAPLVLAADSASAGLARWTTPLAIALLPLAAMAAYGAICLTRTAPAPAADAAQIRIVQPSVPQREKWLPQNQRAIFDQHLSLSRRNAAGEEVGLAGVDVVVWPEAAMPFLPLEQPPALTAIGELLSGGGALITGGLRRAPSANPEQSFGGMDYFNSLMVFTGASATHQVYDKIHLVPFGEYLPMKPLLQVTGLGGLARMRGGFTPGPEPRPLLAAGPIPAFGPLICYEAVFPGAVVQGAQRPRALINLTNDGWFGNTTGPRQHFHQARVRAVEEGLPIVRAANNGISAIIDANGRVLASLGMNEIGVIDSRLPVPVPTPLYGWAGDWTFAANLLLFAVASLYLTRRKAISDP